MYSHTEIEWVHVFPRISLFTSTSKTKLTTFLNSIQYTKCVICVFYSNIFPQFTFNYITLYYVLVIYFMFHSTEAFFSDSTGICLPVSIKVQHTLFAGLLSHYPLLCCRFPVWKMSWKDSRDADHRPRAVQIVILQGCDSITNISFIRLPLISTKYYVPYYRSFVFLQNLPAMCILSSECVSSFAVDFWLQTHLLQVS